MKNRGTEPEQTNKSNKLANLSHDILTTTLSVNSLN